MKNLDLLIQSRGPEKADKWLWATVTQADPLRIRLDGETTPLDITPDTLTRSLTVGQRVWVQLTGRRLVVTGAAGGVPVPEPEEAAPATPTGSVTMFAGSTAPTDWLLCDGAAVSRTTYADLFAVLGTTYGAGDGSTTFNLPDLRDRAPVGASGTKALGSTGGADSVTLSKGNLPPHEHSMNHGHTASSSTAGDHQHEVARSSDTGSHGRRVPSGSVNNDDWPLTEPAGAHSHNITVDNHTGLTGTGSWEGLNSDPFSVQNPFAALNFIIKT